MKIALNMKQGAALSGAAAQDRELDRLLLAARKGDWGAKDRLTKMFLPVIHEVAARRAGPGKDQSLLVEAGRRGVAKAAKRYRPAQGAHAFRISVVEFIERAVNRAAKGSLLYKLFGV